MRNYLHNITGAVLGQAIGDAIGSQTEFASKDKVVDDMGPTWGYDFPAFSDDTQNMMAIAEALLTVRPPVPMGHGKRDGLYFEVTDPLNQLMAEVGNNFIKWVCHDTRWGANNRSPGGACMAGVRRLSQTGPKNWRETGDARAKGNGGAMRSSIVGCYYWQSPFAAFQVGALTSVPTHNNIESLLAAGTVAYLVADAIAGEPFVNSLLSVSELCRDYKKAMLTVTPGEDEDPGLPIARWGQAYMAARAGVAVKTFHRFNGNDFKGVEAVAAAIHANAKYKSYREIVLALANNTGDSDTTAAIGGAIAGARYGASFIPSKWRSRVEKTAYLHDIAFRIHAATGGAQDTGTPQLAHSKA